MFALIFVETLSRRGDLYGVRINKKKVYSQSKTDKRKNFKQGLMKRRWREREM